MSILIIACSAFRRQLFPGPARCRTRGGKNAGIHLSGALVADLDLPHLFALNSRVPKPKLLMDSAACPTSNINLVTIGTLSAPMFWNSVGFYH